MAENKPRAEGPKAEKPKDERRAAMRPIAADLPRLIGKPLGKRGFGEGGLVAEWAAVAGAEIARYTAPLKLSFPRGSRHDGTLTLRTTSAFATELQHIAPQLLERINAYLGYGAIARLKIEQGRLPPRPRRAKPEIAPLAPGEEHDLVTRLEPIADDNLRSALEGLGRAVKGLRRPANPAK